MLTNLINSLEDLSSKYAQFVLSKEHFGLLTRLQVELHEQRLSDLCVLVVCLLIIPSLVDKVSVVYQRFLVRAKYKL